VQGQELPEQDLCDGAECGHHFKECMQVWGDMVWGAVVVVQDVMYAHVGGMSHGIFEVDEGCCLGISEVL